MSRLVELLIEVHGGEIKTMRAAGKAHIEIAAALRVSTPTVARAILMLDGAAPKGLSSVELLIAEHKDALIQMRAEYKSALFIANTLHYDPQTIRKALVTLGLPLRINRRLPLSSDAITAVSLREEGLTLEAIGQTLNVTRERVRQHLVRAGRPDLAKIVLAERPARLVEWHCGGCDKVLLLAPAAAKTKMWCSQKCRGRNLSRFDDGAIEEMIERRREGMSYGRIGELFSCKPVVVYRHLKRYAAHHPETDMSWAWKMVRRHRKTADASPKDGAA
jgi:hypothetical protein